MVRACRLLRETLGLVPAGGGRCRRSGCFPLLLLTGCRQQPCGCAALQVKQAAALPVRPCLQPGDPFFGGRRRAHRPTWIVAVSASSRMISPINFSAPTRTSSYMAEPPMQLATTTGPDTLRM